MPHASPPDPRLTASVTPQRPPSTSRRLAASLGAAAAACAAGWGLSPSAPADLPWWPLLAQGGLLASLAGGLAWALTRPREVIHAAPPPPPEAPREAALSTELLTLAVDLVMTLDTRGALVQLADPQGRPRLAALARHRGVCLWDIPGVEIAPAALQAWQANLSAQQPWRDLVWHWRDPQQRRWRFRCSGVPHRDAQGQCQGFASVLRDLSAELRLQDLFHRLPLALLQHRDERVLDANAAALSLLGPGNLETLRARSLLSHFPEGTGREQARAQLAMPDSTAGAGAQLAVRVGDHRLTQGPTEQRPVRITSVQMEAADGPCTLSILIDDSARLAAEAAAQRAEALLSHLLTTSPDVISLHELGSGRYTTVNPSFTRLTGWPAQEVVGKTPLELGIWADPRQWEQAWAQVREQGEVQNLPTAFRTRDGRVLPTLMSAARLVLDGQDHLVLSCRDTSETDLLRVEYQAIVENALVGIAMTREQHFTMTNPRLDAMLGWSAGSLVGEPTRLVWPDAPAQATSGPVELEHTLRRRDGSTFLARLLGKAVHPSDPSRAGMLWLVEDVTERRQMNRALARARDEAEAASQAKSAFLANTSHEIRTPLNALLGLARLARQPEVDELRRREYIEQIADSATTLSDIISDILDLSKIEAGKMHVDAQPFALEPLLQSLFDAYGALADAKGLHMALVREDELPAVVVGDPVRLRQILSNYLNNALKFTDRGQIRLVVRRSGADRLHFEVRDTGDGIAPEDLGLLFNPFTQVDDSIDRRIGGTGLGLSICRQLAELMGGKVGVQSTVGQGSRFWAELPLPEGAMDVLETTSGNQGLDPIMGARILMVEDNPVNMMIATALLEQWGAEVQQATDGSEAVEAVNRAKSGGRPFDVVLMDVQMPRMSGHEATRVLRRDHSSRQLPIIALTAAALVSERDEALAAGMNDFLTKPIDAQRLRRTLIRVLHQSRRR